MVSVNVPQNGGGEKERPEGRPSGNIVMGMRMSEGGGQREGNHAALDPSPRSPGDGELERGEAVTVSITEVPYPLNANRPRSETGIANNFPRSVLHES